MLQARDLAKGKWASILTSFGMANRYFNGKHQDCPLCKDGKDCFRFDDKDGNGSYFCAKCGSGDGFMFAERYSGLDFKAVAKKIEIISGEITYKKPQQRISMKNAQALVKRVWDESKPIEQGDEAWAYLTSRGLILKAMPSSIRLHPALEYRDGKDSLGLFKTMVSMVASPNGKVVTLHRTYLQDGKKADVPKPKKMLPVPDDMTVNGSAIRFYSVASGVLGIAEGLETALAASQIYSVPVWSCISANGMETFEIPNKSTITELIIFADNDFSFTGQKAAYVLANRIALKNKIKVSVKIPTLEGMDWADMLAKPTFLTENKEKL